MNLFHRRTLCSLSALFLAVGFFAVRIPTLAKLFLLAVCAGLLLIGHLPLPGRGRLRRLLPLFAAAFLALLIPLLSIDLPRKRILSEYREEGNPIEFRITRALDEYGTYIADRVISDGRSLPGVSLLVLSETELPVGASVRSVCRIAPLSETDELYYLQYGAHATITLTDVYSVQRDPRSPIALTAQLSSAFLSRIRTAAGKAGNLFAALLLGETDGLGDRIALHFRRLGISHILAVSGMHFVTISALISALLRRLGLGRGITAAICLPTMLFYTLITGAPPSVLRAFAMTCVLMLSFFFRRQSDSLTSLFFSGALLFLLNPSLLFSVSFLLSFSATLGIICSFSAMRGFSPITRLPRAVRTYLVMPALATVSATLFTLPITLSVFGELSLLALPANLLLALPLQLLLCLSIPLLILGPIPCVTALAELLGGGVLSLIERLSSLPMAALNASHPVALAASLLWLALILLILLLPRVSPQLAVRMTLGASALLAITVLSVSIPRGADRKIRVASDKDSGEFLILATGIGRAVVSCSNGEYRAAEHLTEVLGDMAVTELSLYLTTHYGYGSLSELRTVCRRMLVRGVALPFPENESETARYLEIRDYLEAERIPYVLLTRGGSCTVKGFTLAVSPRAEDGSAYILLIESSKGRAAYVSAGAAKGLDAETVAALRADLLILGSAGLKEEIYLPISPDSYMGELLPCSPLYKGFRGEPLAAP